MSSKIGKRAHERDCCKLQVASRVFGTFVELKLQWCAAPRLEMRKFSPNVHAVLPASRKGFPTETHRVAHLVPVAQRLDLRADLLVQLDLPRPA